jgi:hypothetical protein
VRVSTPRHLAYAEHAWRAFLRKYDDAGHAYIVSFKAEPRLPEVPVDITPPEITGIPIVGSSLTIVHGDWTNSPSFYTDLWERCDASGGDCVPILGATSDTYTPTLADAGQTLVVEEAGWNDGGPGAGVLSAPTAQVIALPLL